MYYLETVGAIGLKVGLNIQITELIKLNEYQRSRSLFELGQRSLSGQNSNLFFCFLDTVESFGTKFHKKVYRQIGMKIYTNDSA